MSNELTRRKPHVNDLLGKYLNEYEGYSASELVKELTRLMASTIDNVYRMAAAVRKADELEVALPEHMKQMHWLRRIAYGQMAPELYVKHQDRIQLVDRAARLAMPEQQQIASDEPVEVGVFDQAGEYTHRMIRPSAMTKEQVNQVFARDHIRDLAEQRSYAEKRAGKCTAPRNQGVVVDAKRGRIIVSGENVPITRKELARYLATLES